MISYIMNMKANIIAVCPAHFIAEFLRKCCDKIKQMLVVAIMLLYCSIYSIVHMCGE